MIHDSKVTLVGIRQEQLRRFVHATTTSFAEIFNKHGHHSKEQSSSRLTDNMQL